MLASTQNARKGIIAGCPLAPTLSKLAVGNSIRQTCVGPDIEYVGTWIDDISIDTENKKAERAATSVVRVFRRLHSALTEDGRQVSIGKTYFLASSPQAEKALRSKLGEGDPPHPADSQGPGCGAHWGAKAKEVYQPLCRPAPQGQRPFRETA